MSDYKLDNLEVSNLVLDPENPRIPPSLHGHDEEDIIQHMIEHASITELMESICENGFFPGEPIIVIPDGNKHIVVEGNRRTTALKLLKSPELANKQKVKINEISERSHCQKPEKIPALIAENKDEVQKYLGFRHITGVKNWKALEKGRYLNQLRNSLLTDNSSLNFTELAKELAAAIGSRSDYVRRVLVAYDLYIHIDENDFFGIDGLNDTTFYFANLVDSLNRSKISSFLNVDLRKEDPLEHYRIDSPNLDNLNEWCTWLFEKVGDNNRTRVKGKSDQLTLLASIIENEVALKEFRSGKTLQEASFLTSHPQKIFTESVSKSIEYLKHAYSVAYHINEYQATLEDQLQEILHICRDIKSINESRKKGEYEL